MIRKQKIKNLIGVALTSAMLLGASGCGKQPEIEKETVAEETEVEKPAIKQQKAIDSSGSYVITYYDTEGRETKVEYHPLDSSVYDVVFTYDDKGNLLKEVWTYPDKLSITENKYDEDGNLTAVYKGESEDSLYLDNEYTYESGRKVKFVNYNDDGSVWNMYIYVYDDNGNLLKETEESDDGYIYRSWEYEYSEDGVLLQMTDTFHENKSVIHYDEEENEILHEYYFKDEYSGCVENEYGPFGLISSTHKDENGDVEICEKTYYYENGKHKCVTRENDDGAEVIIKTWEYDESGNTTHRVSMRGYEYTAEYNEYGYVSWDHDVCTDPTRSAGMFDIETTYEYEYY